MVNRGARDGAFLAEEDGLTVADGRWEFARRAVDDELPFPGAAGSLDAEPLRAAGNSIDGRFTLLRI